MKSMLDLENMEGAQRRSHNYQILAIRSDQGDGKLYGQKLIKQSIQMKTSKYKLLKKKRENKRICKWNNETKLLLE